MKDNFYLAVQLYKNMPFWHRWNIFYYYFANNWDVTGRWEKCVKVANKMTEDFYKLTPTDSGERER